MLVEGDHFSIGAYSFTGENGALLTVNKDATFGTTGGGTSTTTFINFSMKSNEFTLTGGMRAVISGASAITTIGAMNLYENSIVNLNGGSLNLGAENSHNLRNNSRMNVSGGTLNLGTNAIFNVRETSTLSFSSGYNVINNALLRAPLGGDIFSTSFIDVGNGGIGLLTIINAGSTISASSTSDWGRASSGKATVEIFTGGTATVSALRVGTFDAQASLNVSGGELNVSSTLDAGGGTVNRSVQFTVENSGTMTVNGVATFNNQADINLISGTLDFNNTATFNTGSRLDVTGGTLDTTNRGLNFNGGTLTRSTSGSLSSGSVLRIQAGGTATFGSFFDIGNNRSGSLIVTGNGSTFTSSSGLSDWGIGSSGGAIVSIESNAIATLSSLRMGTSDASASVTVTSGGQLGLGNSLTVGGGSSNTPVNLNIASGGSVTVGSSTLITGNPANSSINLQTGGTLSTRNFQSVGGNFNWTGGTLELTGGTTNLGRSLFIPSGGTLKGTGSITGNLAFLGNGHYAPEVDVNPATSDRVTVTGTVVLNSAAALNVTGTPAAGQKHFIVANDGTDAISGTFSGLAQEALVGTFDGIELRISYTGDSASGTTTGGNDMVLYAEASPYDTWSSGAPFDGDANHDGVPNGLAFVLGAPDPNALAVALLPTVIKDTAGLVLTFKMLNAAARGGATLSIEHSSDLGVSDPWATVAVPDATGGPIDGVTFTITGSNPLQVTAIISSSEAPSGKLFGRLKAQIAGSQPF